MLISIGLLCFLPLNFVVFSLPDEEVHHCLYKDETHPGVCRLCQKGYILDQNQAFCHERQKFQVLNHESLQKCIQLSTSEECLRCDCGYALSEQLGVCVITPPSLIGCEVFTAENTCARPKVDYLFLKDETGQLTIQFGRNTHCEIFDVLEGVCQQCHSGYKLNSANKCVRSSQILFNEFFSYFSSDGELKSRSFQFQALSSGVFPVINHCLSYLQTNQKHHSSFPTLICTECVAGRALNRSHTACLKSPIDFCKIISDSDHSLCEECIDSEHFYLASSEIHGQQICLPRQLIHNPMVRCLEYFENSQLCKKCALGLVLTLEGCQLENYYPEVQDIRNLRDNSYLRLLNIDVNCDIWIRFGVCGQCKEGMLVNNKGICQINDVTSCISPFDQGGCHQCQSLKYYDSESKQCIFIQLAVRCQHSSGKVDSCEKCFQNYFLDVQNGYCMGIQNCAILSQEMTACEVCDLMYYLDSTSQKCNIINDFQNCLISDGIINECLKCKRNYQQNELGECVPSLVEVINESGFCNDHLFYFDVSQNTCIQHFFENMYTCQKFNPNENGCLQCMTGQYLKSGSCFIIKNCRLSDGIHNWCYMSWYESGYIDENGQVQFMENGCLTNMIEKRCLNCQGNLLEYLPKDLLHDENIFNGCMDLKQKEENIQQENQEVQKQKYVCDLCQNLFYLDEQNGTCLPLFDVGCEISNGKSNRCSFCKNNHLLNNETGLCEANIQDPIKFCEIIANSVCIKCRSLYYVNNLLCLPISDPDCIESQGVLNKCLKCSNGITILPKISFQTHLIICAEFVHMVEEIHETNRRNSQMKDKSSINENIPPSYDERKQELNGSLLIPSFRRVRNVHIRFAQTNIFQLINIFAAVVTLLLFQLATLRLKQLECKQFDLDRFQCMECFEGYYLSYANTYLGECKFLSISNCVDMSTSEYKCNRCTEGYQLSENGQCFRIEYCVQNNLTSCVKCAEETVLFKGSCVKLDNCSDQVKETCKKCFPGYYLNKKQKREGGNITEQLGYNLKNNGEPELHISMSYFCVKIPFCIESNGFDEFCTKCDDGYMLLADSICVKTTNNSISQPNCEQYNSEINCIRCHNLFYLMNSICLALRELNPMCQSSDGISRNCLKCSFTGWKLSSNGTCENITSCDISNGIDICVVCKEGYAVNLIGECLQIEKKIDNCEIYFMLSQEVESTLIDKSTALDEVSHSLKPFLGCTKCTNFFYVDKQSSFQICLEIPSKYKKSCTFSDGISEFCSVCSPGSLLNIEQFNFKACIVSKKNFRHKNIGCEIILNTGICSKCYDNYVLKNGHCYAKHNDMKCEQFHLQKDECIFCSNGYKLTKIVEHYFAKTVCVRLEEHEKVRNCYKYHSNTNKCASCIKSLKQDIVEYILNEKENTCDDVLHMLCRKIDQLDKTKCLVSFNANEEITESPLGQGNTTERGDISEKINPSSQNTKCRNGYYYQHSESTNSNEINKTCHMHSRIDNCQLYSQIKSNVCEECELLFYLEESMNKCISVSHKNCLIGEKYTDRCALCANSYSIDKTTGGCVQTQIINCLEIKSSQCSKCKDHFYLSEKQNQCLWSLVDPNCKKLNQNNQCIECDKGFLLVHSGDCIDMRSSCKPDNCMIYKSATLPSAAEFILCKKCEFGYFLDEQKQQCSLGNTEENNLQKEQSSVESDEGYALWGVTTIWIISITVVLIIAAVIVILIRRKIRRQQSAFQTFNKQENNSFENTNIEFQLEKSIQINQSEVISYEL